MFKLYIHKAWLTGVHRRGAQGQGPLPLCVPKMLIFSLNCLNLRKRRHIYVNFRSKWPKFDDKIITQGGQMQKIHSNYNLRKKKIIIMAETATLFNILLLIYRRFNLCLVVGKNTS